MAPNPISPRLPAVPVDSGAGTGPQGGVSGQPELSLVIPVFNEAGNVLPLAKDAVRVLRGLGRPFEVIFVNDGSTDGTSAEIAQAQERAPEVRELALAANAGQATALLTGLRAARGQFLLMMDGDGQNDPRDFPALLELVETGACDLACGWRVDRHDTTLRRIMSRVANLVRGAILHDGVHDSGCQLRVMRRDVRDAFFPMELMQSFIPALAVAAGFRVGEKPVRHHARTRGDSKYGFRRLLWRPAVAMLGLKWKILRGGIRRPS